MAYNFATPQYVSSLKGLPLVDIPAVRAAAVKAVKSFQPSSWYDSPIVTLLSDSECVDGTETEQTTVDAFGKVNGKQLCAGDEVVEKVKQHVLSASTWNGRMDLRQKVRAVEEALLQPALSGTLIANQLIDFGKQDGVTEIEEAIEANAVERRLNDSLLEDESAGVLTIPRHPAFIGCVSNFTNFLDLSRKCLRNLELGVPVVVLSRSNTSQHMFRWSVLLRDLLRREGVSSDMVTYLCASIAQQRYLMRSCPGSPVYFTGSRDIARKIKDVSPKLLASTGGPNTMIATRLTPDVMSAIRISSCIEHAGQCTALRLLVTPECSEKRISEIYEPLGSIESPLQSLQEATCSSLLASNQNVPRSTTDYKKHHELPVHFRIQDELPSELDEEWRNVVLDITTAKDLHSQEMRTKLSSWLIAQQPISLAVNGDTELALALFESTGMVVYTVGSEEKPALTAQARPQSGEIFGEIPPRKSMQSYTSFPVFVPSSTPAYFSTLSPTFLEEKAAERMPKGLEYLDPVRALLSTSGNGYLIVLAEYLVSACGPKRGTGTRTSLFGLQRPPIGGGVTVLRCPEGGEEGDIDTDAVAIQACVFAMSNARDQFQVSVSSEQSVTSKLLQELKGVGVSFIEESNEQFKQRSETAEVYNILGSTRSVLDNGSGMPLAANFMSRLFCIGHVKSVESEDQAFIDKFSKSAKWLLPHYEN